ncbi:hypothetical protein [Mesorhizobium sp. CN2-181]|uniref:hypothetical protein n=1 Tax=Mesorhizobium yinganensis TaxID=3157707 RepID=UPI0032B75C59
MDGTAAVETNREALKRILAMLVGMAAMGGATLPRRLHRAILRLLRPAEAATRRLIIVVACGMAVALPPPRPRKPRPNPGAALPVLHRLGIAATMSRADLRRVAAARRAAALRAARPRTLSLPLFDPPRRPFRVSRRSVPAHAAPRISGFDALPPLPPPPSPDDPVDAARLGLRLQALAAALDDLPAQAKRFALWQARRDAATAQDRQAGTGRLRRTSPLRRGRPPGGRLSRYDPVATHSRKIREVDEILAHAHALAVFALERRDTS